MPLCWGVRFIISTRRKNIDKAALITVEYVLVEKRVKQFRAAALIESALRDALKVPSR